MLTNELFSKFVHIPLILASILISSCLKSSNEKRNVSINLVGCQSLSFKYEQKIFNFQHKKIGKDYVYFNSKDGYKLDSDSIYRWNMYLLKLEDEKNNQGVSLAGLKDLNIVCKRNQDLIHLQGYKTDKEFSVVNVLTSEDRNSYYFKTSDFNKIFTAIENLRMKKLDISFQSKIYYFLNDKKFELNESQRGLLFKVLSNYQHKKFLYSGEILPGTLNHYGFLQRVNSNMLGHFLIGNKKLFLARHDPDKFDVDIWLEGSRQVVRGVMPNYFDLKQMEMKEFVK